MFYRGASILSHFAHLGRIQTGAQFTDCHKNLIQCLSKKLRVKANSKNPDLLSPEVKAHLLTKTHYTNSTRYSLKEKIDICHDSFSRFTKTTRQGGKKPWEDTSERTQPSHSILSYTKLPSLEREIQRKLCKAHLLENSIIKQLLDANYDQNLSQSIRRDFKRRSCALLGIELIRQVLQADPDKYQRFLIYRQVILLVLGTCIVPAYQKSVIQLVPHSERAQQAT